MDPSVLKIVPMYSYSLTFMFCNIQDGLKTAGHFSSAFSTLTIMWAGRFFAMQAVLCVVNYIAAFLTSTYYTPLIMPSSTVITKDVFRHLEITGQE